MRDLLIALVAVASLSGCPKDETPEPIVLENPWEVVTIAPVGSSLEAAADAGLRRRPPIDPSPRTSFWGEARTDRLRISRGWLYREIVIYNGNATLSTTFVPDAHEPVEGR